MSDISNRISILHTEIFHGLGNHPEADQREREGQDFPPIPGISNNYREPLHLTRSGTFIPAIFIVSGSFVVSREVFGKIKHVNNVEGEPVVFEKLVDLPMPALGDMSWYTRDLPYSDDPDPVHEYDYLEDDPLLHQKVGTYYELLGANRRDLPKDQWPLQKVTLNFGRYFSGWMSSYAEVSKTVLERYPIIAGASIILRGDIFEIIAPYLDLDYFAIDVISADKIKQ